MTDQKAKKVGGAGLRGQSAGETKLCTVGKTGSGLTYNGYDVADLAENTTFLRNSLFIFHGELCLIKFNWMNTQLKLWRIVHCLKL